MNYLLIKIINLDIFPSRIYSINMLVLILIVLILIVINSNIKLLFPYLIPKCLKASFQLLQIQMTAGKVKCQHYPMLVMLPSYNDSILFSPPLKQSSESNLKSILGGSIKTICKRQQTQYLQYNIYSVNFPLPTFIHVKFLGLSLRMLLKDARKISFLHSHWLFSCWVRGWRISQGTFLSHTFCSPSVLIPRL